MFIIYSLYIHYLKNTTYKHLCFIYKMQTAVFWATKTAGKMVITTAISPMVQSTLSIITSLRTNSVNTQTLQNTIDQYDIPCTLQTIEATCLALKCNKEPLKTAAQHVCETIASINSLLTKIADITASHEAGYISRWRTLIIDEEIEHLKRLMGTLDHRFKLMCNIRQVVND